MTSPVEIAEYDPAWRPRFAALGAELRRALGPVAVRIDHIGSTAVPGLAAKPVVDVQISVVTLDPVEVFAAPLQELGWRYRSENPERTKRYFREPPGRPRTHVHVRRSGSFSEQFPLLLRDFLRQDGGACDELAAVKRRCAAEHRHDRAAYVTAKDAFVWELVRRADRWAQHTGWQPGPSDA